MTRVSSVAGRRRELKGDFAEGAVQRLMCGSLGRERISFGLSRKWSAVMYETCDVVCCVMMLS